MHGISKVFCNLSPPHFPPQAHAWVPGLLLSLMDRAQVLHRMMREELSQELLGE